MPVDVKVHKGETVEKALRRLKRKLIYENILRDTKDKRYFEAPSEKRRRKKKVAAFNNMLRQKHDFL